MKSYNQLSSSDKVHDNYLYNLKIGCVGSVDMCILSYALLSIIKGSAKCINAAGNFTGSISWIPFNSYGIVSSVFNINSCCTYNIIHMAI